MASPRGRASVHRDKEPRQRPPGSRSSCELAERDQAVVAVGAWVEEGPDFQQHPTVLALETERLLAEKMREKEKRLRRLREGVRHRLAQQARVCHERRLRQRDGAATRDRRNPQFQFKVLAHHETAAYQKMKDRSFEEASERMRQVRLRLAACRVTPREDAASNLPGGEWSITPTPHSAEEGRDDGDDRFSSYHNCPLVQYKASRYTKEETDKPRPDQSSKSSPASQTLPWLLTDKEELKKQRQTQLLKHRQQAMNSERERVKEKRQYRKHLKKTASIKAEKERLRLEEESRLERGQHLREVRHTLQERELQVRERLRLDEEHRKQELQRKSEENRKITRRYVDALRAQTKQRLSNTKWELPLLCCCASSFWDSHPDTCANNCVFHNNPQAYVQALQSTVVGLELQ